MITIVYSTHKDETYNNKFRQHLLQTVGLKNVQILEYVNHNQFSLTELYNRGIRESINNIIVCVHNDVKIENNWGKKLLEDYSNNPEFGIIGIAGTTDMINGQWWTLKESMTGIVSHKHEGKKWTSSYSKPLNKPEEVVLIDGLFMCFDDQ
jgi:PDZ domain-containing secreted protein